MIIYPSPFNETLFLFLIKKDFENYLNKVDSSSWNFQSLKTFPIKKGKSCLLPCCPDEKNYRSVETYNNCFYLVESSFSHILVGVRWNKKSIYKIYGCTVTEEKEEIREIDSYDDEP
jgi:hypothetical protein